MMHSYPLLLLLCCPWPGECNRRPPSDSLKGRPPQGSLESPHIMKRSPNKTMRSPKSVEDVGCMPTDGTPYLGNVNTTKSGLACQMWSVDTPQDHNYNDVGDHNYCRKLSGLNLPSPFCYTTDPEKRWEYCDVTLCFYKGKLYQKLWIEGLGHCKQTP